MVAHSIDWHVSCSWSCQMGRPWRARGFTLVELMITVAIVSVLAAIGIFGVRRYLFAAKSSEAINLIGSIKHLRRLELHDGNLLGERSRVIVGIVLAG